MVTERGLTEEGEDTSVGTLGLISYHNVVTPNNMDWNIVMNLVVIVMNP
jgi:hypothetical protein